MQTLPVEIPLAVKNVVQYGILRNALDRRLVCLAVFKAHFVNTAIVLLSTEKLRGHIKPRVIRRFNHAAIGQEQKGIVFAIINRFVFKAGILLETGQSSFHAFHVLLLSIVRLYHKIIRLCYCLFQQTVYT